MSKRFQFHSVRSKLIALGAIFAAIIVAFTLVAANTFSSMTNNSAASSRASHAEALVDEAYQHWASDDGQSNMYVAVLALRDPSQLQLAETTWGQAAQAFKDSNKSVDAAAKIVSNADERAALTAARDGLAKYDQFSQQIRVAGQAGEVARAVKIATVDNLDASNGLTDTFDKWQVIEQKHAAQLQAEVASQGRQGRTTLIILGVAGLAVAIAGLVLIGRGIVRPINRAVTSLKALAAKDFTQSMEVDTADETRVMADSLNEATESLRGALGEIAGSSQTLSAAASELMTIATQMGATAEETSAQSDLVSHAGDSVSASVSSVATAVEEMTASIHEIAQSAAEAATVAGEAVTAAETSSAAVAKLGDASIEIGDVVKTITDIAEQTNLLALNATIEAARAGESGKGFAVVAHEVKDLATETARATSDIATKVQAIQQDTGDAVDSIARIDEIIHRIADLQSTIASAVEQQAATTDEIGRNVAEAAAGTGEIAGNIAGVADAASSTAEAVGSTQQASSELARLAADLQTLVDQFHYEMSS
jgi:methyl-accepting chemotaxis protein